MAVSDPHAPVTMREPSLLCLLILVTSGTALRAMADEPPSASPAGFFLVDENGRSVPEDPVASGFAQAPDRPPAAKLRPAPPDSRDPQPIASHRVTIKVRSEADRRETDPTAAWRCETAGFYYTQDGRCVAPAYRREPAPTRRATRARRSR